MKSNNANYNRANPVELIHKYTKDSEIINDLEERIQNVMASLKISRPEILSELCASLYFILCYGGRFKSLGEEYSYLTHFHATESIFLSKKRAVAFFILKAFGASIARQFDKQLDS